MSGQRFPVYPPALARGMAVESGPRRNNYNSGNRRLRGVNRLHQEILKHDGWRCQACGSLRGLEVHHMQRRSQSGDDCSLPK